MAHLYEDSTPKGLQTKNKPKENKKGREMEAGTKQRMCIISVTHTEALPQQGNGTKIKFSPGHLEYIAQCKYL